MAFRQKNYPLRENIEELHFTEESKREGGMVEDGIVNLRPTDVDICLIDPWKITLPIFCPVNRSTCIFLPGPNDGSISSKGESFDW
jgi:hypothetical protein